MRAPLGEDLAQLMKLFDDLAVQDGMPSFTDLASTLKTARESGDRENEAKLLLDMGVRLLSIGQASEMISSLGLQIDIFEVMTKAIDYLRESFTIAKSVSLNHVTSLALMHLGDSYFVLNQYEDAVQCFEETLQFKLEPLQSYYILEKIGDIHLKSENARSALISYQKALDLAKEIDDPAEQAKHLGKLASAYANLKDYPAAIKYYQDSLALWVAIRNDEMLFEKIVVHRNLLKLTSLDSVVAHTEDRIVDTQKRFEIYQQIAALPKIHQVRFRHTNHYLSRLESIRDAYEQADIHQHDSLVLSFEEDWDQIRYAQEWASANLDKYEIAAQMCSHFASTAVEFLNTRVSVHTLINWRQAGLKAAENLGDRQSQSGILINLSYNLLDYGKTDEAFAQIQKVIELSHEIQDQETERTALICLSAIYYQLGRYKDAQDAYIRGTSHNPDSEDGFVTSEYLSHQVVLDMEQGEIENAITNGNRELEAARTKDHQGRIAKALGNLGLLYSTQGQYTKALKLLQEAIEITKQIGDKPGQSASLSILGTIYQELGEFDEALSFYEEALTIVQQLEDRSGQENIIGNIGVLYIAKGQPEKAKEYIFEALKIAESRNHKVGQANALVALGNILIAEQKFEQAADYAERALLISQEINNPRIQATALYSLGVAFIKLELLNKAENLLNQSLKLIREIGLRPLEAKAVQSLGSIYFRDGRREQAYQNFQQARDIFVELGQSQELEITNKVIASLFPNGAPVPSSAQDNDLKIVQNMIIEWIGMKSWEEKSNYLKSHSDSMLTETAEIAFTQLLSRVSSKSQPVVESHLILLRASRKIGIAEAHEEFRWKNSPEYREEIFRIISDWILSRSWSDSKEFLWQHGDILLSDWTIFLANQALANQARENVLVNPTITFHLQLLTEASKIGIDEVYNQYKRNWPYEK